MEPSIANFPPKPFVLSAQDERHIKALADRLVTETVHANLEYLSRGGMVDPNCWKVIKEKDNIVAYRELKSSRSTRRERLWSEDTDIVAVSPQQPSFYPTSDRSLQEALWRDGVANIDDDSDDEGGWHRQDFGRFGGTQRDHGPGTSVLERYRPEHTPIVIAAGTFPGTVEDMALGFLADTDDRSRMRHNTNKDVLVDDLRMLTQIQGPTQEDPFRFLGIKWCSHLPGRAVSLVVKPRDYVVFESTGMAIDSNGQRFSYMLNHSLDIDEVPDYRDFGQVRIAFSTCYIFRQREIVDKADTVEVFGRGFMDAGGRYTVRIATSQFADGLLAVPGIMEEAYMKKLTWLLYQQHLRSGSISGTSDSTGSSSCGSRSMINLSDNCPCCCDKLSSRFGGLLDRTTTCSLCRQTICHKCTVKKSIPLAAAPGRHFKKKDMEFCVNCFLKAKRMSAWKVAIATLSKPAPRTSM